MPERIFEYDDCFEVSEKGREVEVSVNTETYGNVGDVLITVREETVL